MYSMVVEEGGNLQVDKVWIHKCQHDAERSLYTLTLHVRGRKSTLLYSAMKVCGCLDSLTHNLRATD